MALEWVIQGGPTDLHVTNHKGENCLGLLAILGMEHQHPRVKPTWQNFQHSP